MSKQVQKKIIEINHALSGYHGEQMRSSANICYETRKDILKKLQRKKKLAAVISDQLYHYLEKFPEEKMGLHQQSFKKKKAKLLEADEKVLFSTPHSQLQFDAYFPENPFSQLSKIKHLFMKPLIESESSSEQ